MNGTLLVLLLMTLPIRCCVHYITHPDSIDYLKRLWEDL